MDTCTRSRAKALLLATLIFCTATAIANNGNGNGNGNGGNARYFAAFTNSLFGGQNQGLWLEDTSHPGSAPIPVTNQILDGVGILSGASISNTAILDDWSYDQAKHEAVNVRPALLVYGLGGQLFSVSLRNPGNPQHFSNGAYSQLCGLTALDGQPYAANSSYVEAFVIPNGSPGSCSTPNSVQTWLIPAGANANTAPTIEPAHWTVLGAFSDAGTGAFVSWIVWNGSQVEADNLHFSSHTSLLVGLPAGPAPAVISQVGQTAFVLSGSGNGVSHTDNIYRITPNSGNTAANLSYALTSPCNGNAGGTTTDAPSGLVAVVEPTDTGYAVYSLPIAGGAATVIYSDASGTECGTSQGDSVSAARVVLNEFDPTFINPQRLIGVNENGPALQAPVVLVTAAANQTVFAHYTIHGHIWIDVDTFPVSGPIQFAELVMDGDGTVLENYPNARLGDDIWGGFFQGGNSAIDRDVVYLFMPTGGLACNGATLVAVDTSNFGLTNINGVPVDACRTLAYGWVPASIGYVQEPGGVSAISIDPVGGQLYLLTGPQNTGFYTNLSFLPGYPFY